MLSQHPLKKSQTLSVYPLYEKNTKQSQNKSMETINVLTTIFIKLIHQVIAPTQGEEIS